MLEKLMVRDLPPISSLSPLGTPSQSDPQRQTAQARRKLASSGLLQRAAARARDRPKSCFRYERSRRRYAALRSIDDLLEVLALTAPWGWPRGRAPTSGVPNAQSVGKSGLTRAGRASSERAEVVMRVPVGEGAQRALARARGLESPLPGIPRKQRPGQSRVRTLR